MPWMVVGAVAQVPAVVSVISIKPTTLNGKFVLAFVEYTAFARSEPVPIATELASPTSSRTLPPDKFTIAGSIVPLLSRARITNLATLALAIPNVAPEGMTSVAGPNVRLLTVPLPGVGDLKSRTPGPMPIVNSPADTVAVISWICLAWKKPDSFEDENNTSIYPPGLIDHFPSE
jgi:hypothetical protein